MSEFLRSRDLERELHDEHDEIDQLLESLLNATDSADPAVLQRAWSSLETSLLHHLELEEARVFPSAERRRPDTVSRLRREHEQIRRLLAELGVRADLHTFRRSAAEDLLRLLRSHAAFELAELCPEARELAPQR